MLTKDPSKRDVVVVALEWVGEVLNEKKPEEMKKKKRKKERKEHLLGSDAEVRFSPVQAQISRTESRTLRSVQKFG